MEQGFGNETDIFIPLIVLFCSSNLCVACDLHFRLQFFLVVWLIWIHNINALKKYSKIMVLVDEEYWIGSFPRATESWSCWSVCSYADQTQDENHYNPDPSFLSYLQKCIIRHLVIYFLVFKIYGVRACLHNEILVLAEACKTLKHIVAPHLLFIHSSLFGFFL